MDRCQDVSRPLASNKHKILVDDYKVCLGLSKQELMNINSFITPNDR